VDAIPYITCYEAGNLARDHRIYAKIEGFFNSSPHAPGFNDEPYYPYHNVSYAQVHGEVVVSNSARDNYFARAQMYGNFLSGALPGHVYGSGAFGGDTRGEPRSTQWPYIWEALRFSSLLQMEHFRDFALSEGAEYQNLLLASGDLSVRKAAGSFDDGLDGWAYMMRTTDKRIAFLYFENGCAAAIRVSGMLPKTDYTAQWFDTWTGAWIPMGTGTMTTDSLGAFVLPSYPSRANATNANDWAASLTVKGGTANRGGGLDMRRRPALDVVRNAVRVYVPGRFDATIDIVAMNGSRVKTVYSGEISEGNHVFSVINHDAPNGMYILRLRLGNQFRLERRFLISR
jgi:hypothetical protein